MLTSPLSVMRDAHGTRSAGCVTGDDPPPATRRPREDHGTFSRAFACSGKARAPKSTCFTAPNTSATSNGDTASRATAASAYLLTAAFTFGSTSFA